MHIIGLGNAGCAIATEFGKLDGYDSILRIDSEELEKNDKYVDLFIPKQKSAEEYESNTPNFKKYFKKLKGDVLFFVAGSGNISMCSLSILEQIKRNCNITAIYIKPDIEFLGAQAKLREKLVYNVFQEYARSGLFERLYLVSNIKIEQCLGGISIISYFDKINEAIVSAFDMLFKFGNSKSITNTFSELPIGTRISTIGLLEPETNEEKMFFDLDFITDSVYYLAYNEEILKEDKNLFNSIKNMVKSKLENGISRVTYGIFATNYDNPIVLCVNHTSVIQN